jgi:hypothetical protein
MSVHGGLLEQTVAVVLPVEIDLELFAYAFNRREKLALLERDKS